MVFPEGNVLERNFWIVEGARVLINTANLPFTVAVPVYVLRMSPYLISSNLSQFFSLMGEKRYFILVCFPLIFGEVDYT